MMRTVLCALSACSGVPQASGGRPCCIIGAPGSWQTAQAPANKVAASGCACCATVACLSARLVLLRRGRLRHQRGEVDGDRMHVLVAQPATARASRRPSGRRRLHAPG